jgi:nitroimidazol reductase NimA-like FMN-containing flavoprotein (pyridoxamine 5'-phosphate oxidase superfamily)
VDDPAALARSLIDASLYLVLGTADEDGLPWASPVYFAHSEHRDFFWVSKPDARHSRNIAARPDVSIVIFDSSVPIGTGQGVYMTAVARELEGEDQAAGLEVYSRRALEHGGRAFTRDDVGGSAALRFYRATAAEQFVLDDFDRRVPVQLAP